MIIGVPKEIKNNENRVGLVPGGVHTLVNNGHKLIIEKGAGLGCGITDDDFVNFSFTASAILSCCAFFSVDSVSTRARTCSSDWRRLEAVSFSA